MDVVFCHCAQVKKSKLSGIKNDCNLTNRSRSTDLWKEKKGESELYSFCVNCKCVLKCADQQKLTENVNKILNLHVMIISR